MTEHRVVYETRNDRNAYYVDKLTELCCLQAELVKRQSRQIAEQEQTIERLRAEVARLCGCQNCERESCSQ